MGGGGVLMLSLAVFIGSGGLTVTRTFVIIKGSVVLRVK